MKKYIVILIAFVGVFVTAQEKLNSYKYVVIPSRFDFQKIENQYNLNRLLQLKFKQLGFEAYLDTDTLPQEVKTNTCSYLKPIAISKSNMFKTEVVVQVLDCDNTILFETQKGISRSKNYKISYNEALRNALKSFRNYRLQYDNTQDNTLNSVAELNTQKMTQLNLETASSRFIMNGDAYFFSEVKNSVFYKKIMLKKTLKAVGKMSHTSKVGVYHIIFENKKGIGYYDEMGSFIVEFLEDDGSVTLKKFQRVD